MFVVRTIAASDKTADLEAFSDLRQARMRYSAKSIRAADQEIDSVALFQVQGVDEPAAAIAAVEAGDATVGLLESVTASDLRAQREDVRKSES